MKTDKQNTGIKGELLAVAYLEQKGYEIVEQNWRFSRAELDIIAKDGEVLVFVEVKTRSYDTLGTPEYFVNKRKKSLMIDAANVFMEEIGHEWEIRFDIIAIVLYQHAAPSIRHFEDAFFSNWNE